MPANFSLLPNSLFPIMKILFFGDIIGKIGRRAMKQILPELKNEYQPDLIMANVENAAHGVGVTEKTLAELAEAGVQVFTSGNHIFSKPEAEALLNIKDSALLRPANYPPGLPGADYKIIEIGSKAVVIINLLGRVFMKGNFDCPFRKLDEILAKIPAKNIGAIIVDFHAQASSEKTAFGWYADGRVSAVLGTHTHIPTADCKILPQGTAFVSDAGMVGALDSVIGDKKEEIIKSFLTQTNAPIEIPEEGEVEVGAVLVEIDPATKKAVKIGRVDRKIRV